MTLYYLVEKNTNSRVTNLGGDQEPLILQEEALEAALLTYERRLRRPLEAIEVNAWFDSYYKPVQAAKRRVSQEINAAKDVPAVLAKVGLSKIEADTEAK